MEQKPSAEIVDFAERRAKRFFLEVEVPTATLYAFPGCELPPPAKYAIQSGQMRFGLTYRLNRASEAIRALENLYFPVDTFVERLQDAEQLFNECEQHCPQPQDSDRGNIWWGYHWVTLDEGRLLDSLTEMLRRLCDEVEDAVKWLGHIHEYSQEIDGFRALTPNRRRLYVRPKDMSNPNIVKFRKFAKDPENYLQNLEKLLDRAYAGIESGAFAQVREDIRTVGRHIAQLHHAMEQLPRTFKLECLDGGKE